MFRNSLSKFAFTLIDPLHKRNERGNSETKVQKLLTIAFEVAVDYCKQKVSLNLGV